MRRHRIALTMILTGVICIAPLPRATITLAQEEAAAEAPAATPLPPADPAKALTTQTPTIPLLELELLVKPLTLEELTNEAAAWMILLQTKAKEISSAEIAVKRQNLSIEKQNEAAAALDQAKTALAAAEQAQADAEPGSPAYEEATAKVEEAKANLTTAQQAVQESSAAKEELAADETLQTALAQSQTTGDLEAAKKVLEQAKDDRNTLTAGSTAYTDATAKIDALEKAILEVEAAQAAQAKTVPDTPEFQEAAAQVKAAQTALLEARSAIDGTQTDPNAAANQEAADKVDEAAAQIDAAQPADGDTNPEGTPGQPAAEEDLGQKQEALDTTIDTLQASSEVDAQVKEDLLVTVTNLQAEQTALIDRLNVVLKELARKGGDVSSYEKYIQAISAITIDAQDTQGLAVRLWSWVRSEQGGGRWAINIGKFVGILGASIIVSRFLAKSADRALQNFGNTSELFRQFTVMIVRRGGVVIGVLLALTALEVSLAPILAVVGGASFILAFALQSNLGNLASGLMLLVYKPFDVGDEVKVAGLWGYVDSITLASTRLKGWAGQIYTLPNNTVWNDIIENLTADEIRKGSFTVRLAFDADLPRVAQVLTEMAKAHPLVLEDPAPGVFLWDYGDYTVNLLFGYWAKLDDFWTVWQDLHYQILERFPEENIEMPYPHQHIHLVEGGDRAMHPSAHTQHDSSFTGTKHPEGGDGAVLMGDAGGAPDGPG